MLVTAPMRRCLVAAVAVIHVGAAVAGYDPGAAAVAAVDFTLCRSCC